MPVSAVRLPHKFPKAFKVFVRSEIRTILYNTQNFDAYHCQYYKRAFFSWPNNNLYALSSFCGGGLMASKWQKPLLSLMRLRHMKNLSEYFRTTVCLQNRHYTHNGFSSIFALSSGHGKCGVSVIRVSGPHSSTTLCQMGRFEQHPEPRKAYVRKIYHSVSEEVLDKALVLWFPGKNELIHFIMTV